MKPSLLRSLASEITRKNTGKVRVEIGQSREMIKLIAMAVYRNPALLGELVRLGKRHSK